MKPVRVLVVEDDDRFRDDLVSLIGSRSELRLAAAFRAAEPALSAIGAGLEIDVALVDLGLPRMSGHELIRRLKADRPALEIVVLTVLSDDDSLYGALRAGASGYLIKGGVAAELADAVLQVHRGGAPMSPSIARRILREFRDSAVVAEPSLTPRETEVLKLLARGASYPEIGTMLAISLSTVQFHIRAIYRKLEVGTKAEATAEAFRRGMIR
jgi:DNA-binding NarL/FixJ family response regulator